MTKDMPDYMRGFDHDDGDWGFTPVNKPPEDDKPGVDASVIENSNIEIAKVKSDVSSIKSMMNDRDVYNIFNSISFEMISEDV